ncbi:MAG: MATE family efflux transporter [Streptococcaceae bacterium]|jgi:putative MATE family efflux protein|nr:MATE family efflux transporter [Streptococcaceae bacterium]
MKSTAQIIKFALPAVMENFLQMLIGFVDTFLVAHIGLAAISAVTVAGTVILIYQALFIALGSMISSLVAKQWAEKRDTALFEHSALKLTLLIGLGLGLFTLLAASPMLTLFGAEGSVHQLALLYLLLVGGFILLLALMTSLSAISRAHGNTRLPMWASLTTNGVNIALAALFIFIFHWGVAGAAMATVFARLIGTALLFVSLQRRLNIHFRLSALIKTPVSRKLVRQALPAAGERLFMRLGDLLLFILILSFGNAVYAGNAIGESITQFIYMTGFGLATVTVVLVAEQFGMQNRALIARLIRQTFWLSALSMGVISGSLWYFSSVLSGFFTSDRTAIAASNTVILYSFIASFFVAGTLTYTAAFQAIGKPKLPFWATTLGVLFFRLAVGFLFGIFFRQGLAGVQLAIILDNIFRFIFLKLSWQNAFQKLP